MTFWLSEPFESLLPSGPGRIREEDAAAGAPEGEASLEVDTLIVGSGYGAAMAALVLSEGRRLGECDLWVLERGEEYRPGDFPKGIGDLPGYASVLRNGRRTGSARALWDIRVGAGASALVGSGLGGGSLINGAVALEPPEDVWEDFPSSGSDGRPVDWRTRLAPSYQAVREILDVRVHPRADSLPKYQALARLGAALGTTCRPLPLAIAFDSGPNRAGVVQPACVDCGNCVSGCNSGAKNTLAMNVWPLVRGRGVRIFTGACVAALARRGDGGYPWVVRVEATRDLDGAAHHRPVRGREVHARRVILAAGTIGSTEILMRSREAGLDVAPGRLGSGFSVNGDLLAFGYGQRRPVHGVATGPSLATDRKGVAPPVGPTAVGWLRVRTAGGRPVTVEDGSIPWPLARIWQELLVTQSLARRLAGDPLPAPVAGTGGDPLAVTARTGTHAQSLLIMGREHDRGRLRWDGPPREADGERRGLVPEWPHPDPRPPGDHFDEVLALLEDAEGAGGFDGGELLTSPPWQTFPERLRAAVGGLDRVGRHLVAAHPLGGCPMGATAADGVVDVEGRVFRSNGDPWPDLHVLDGAILPGAVGANPFLTIAALAHCLATGIRAADAARTPLPIPSSPGPSPPGRPPPGTGHPVPAPADTTVGATVRERLLLDLWEDRDGLLEPRAGEQARLARLLALPGDAFPEGVRRLVLDVAIEVPDILGWLSRPSGPLQACFRLRGSRSMSDTAPDTHLLELGSPWELTGRGVRGEVILGGLDAPPDGLLRTWRAVLGIGRFVRLRGEEILWRLGQWLAGAGPGTGDGGGILRFLTVSWAQARVQADWRHLGYRFRTRSPTGEILAFEGRKLLRYAPGAPDPLTALRTLPFELSRTGSREGRFRGTLEVDLIRFLDALGPFQVSRTPDTPTSALAVAGVGAFFLRAVLQTHFWSFAAPPHERYPCRREANARRLAAPPTRLSYRYRGVGPEMRSREVRFHLRTGDGDPVRLTRYRPAGHGPGAGEGAGPVLLIHGLAHGSRVFWTGTAGTSLARYLLGRGHDVWLLDHRLSANLHLDPDPGLDIDTIAAEDIAWAFARMEQVLAGEGVREPRVRVFAHCVGAAAFGIWALSRGPDSRPGTGIVDRAVIHAAPPWLAASRDNRWRANALSAVRHRIQEQDFDPLPHRLPPFTDTLLDRFAFSFPWSPEDRRRHQGQERGHRFSRTVCDRMTLFYGDEWEHANLSPATHRELDTLVGPAPLQTLLQIYFCIERGRLTAPNGENIHVTRANLVRNWRFPTLFLHGARNKVFSPESTRVAAERLRRVHALERCPSVPPPPVHAVIVPGYGHMDMLFGARASEEVFPRVGEFLSDELPEPPEREVKRTRPRTHVEPLPWPTTGPILSVRRGRAGPVVRTWLETGDGEELRPEEVTVNLGPTRTMAREKRRLREWPRLLTGRFWLASSPVPAPGARSELEVAVRYPSIGCPTGGSGPASCGPSPVRISLGELPWFERLTNPEARPPGRLAFLAGSCLHPGLSIEGVLSDGIWAAMWPHIRGGGAGRGAVDYGVDHVLLCGDQIYADATAGLFDPRSPWERYRARYRGAWGGVLEEKGREAHAVLSRVPVYMAIDDHEIRDDWAGEEDADSLWAVGREEAWHFQMHHVGDASDQEARCWYRFRSAGYPFFVLDTRSHRAEAGRPARSGRRRLFSRGAVASLLGERQTGELRRWLGRRHCGEVLFLVSGSPLGPVSRDAVRHPALLARADGLLGYPEFLAWLTVQGTGRRVVWVTGDPHFSSLCELTLRHRCHSLDVVQVCASGLFAPLPFARANPAAFEWDAPIRLSLPTAGGPLLVSGRQRLLSDSASHFVRVDVAGNPGRRRLEVRAVDREGVPGESLSVPL